MVLWRPVIAEPPLCTLRELQDGTYDLCDLADFHEALNVRQEVAAQVAAWQKAKKGKS